VEFSTAVKKDAEEKNRALKDKKNKPRTKQTSSNPKVDRCQKRRGMEAPFRAHIEEASEEEGKGARRVAMRREIAFKKSRCPIVGQGKSKGGKVHREKKGLTEKKRRICAMEESKGR